MASKPITLVLNGEVTLTDYVKAISKVSNLISALNDELFPQHRVEWQIEELEAGSATSTVTCPSDAEEDIKVADSIVKRYHNVGRDAHRGDVSNYSPQVQEAIHGITEIINVKIPSIRLETEDGEWEIYQRTRNSEPASMDTSSSLQFL